MGFALESKAPPRKVGPNALAPDGPGFDRTDTAGYNQICTRFISSRQMLYTTSACECYESVKQHDERMLGTGKQP